jgi:hypothetical protein
MKQEHLDANLAEKVDNFFINASLYAENGVKRGIKSGGHFLWSRQNSAYQH